MCLSVQVFRDAFAKLSVFLLADQAACMCVPVQVFEWLMCSDEELDSHRFMDTIQAAIDEGTAALITSVPLLLYAVHSLPA